MALLVSSIAVAAILLTILKLLRKARKAEAAARKAANDPQKLKAIRHRIQAQMNGLDVSAGKVRKRVRFLERFTSWVRKETSDEAA